MPKRTSHLLALSTVVLMLALTADAQTNPPAECPTVEVNGPTGFIEAGELANYSASVNVKGTDYRPNFLWTISAGEIHSGQGTDSLTVRRPNSSLTVTVELIGLPKGCTATSSESTSGPHPPPLAVKIGEMRNMAPPDPDVIKLFRDELKKHPNNQGYIFIAYPPITPPAEVKAREHAVLTALLTNSHDGTRITMVRMTSSRDITEFWHVPPGADYPMCEGCDAVRGGCPSIGIERGAGIVTAGDRIEFRVNDRDDVGGLAFHWTVKNGKIESGQGTSTIRVLPVTYLTRPVEAAVKVRGLPEGCANTFEESYAVPCHPYLATSVDVSFWSEYRSMPWTQERSQLGGIFARGLRWQPQKIVYIEKGFPLNSTARTRDAAITRIRTYVLSTLKIPRSKLYIRSRIGRSVTRLYLVPDDAPVLDPNWKEACIQE